FHAVYSLVDPLSGKAIRTQNKQVHDELASRRAEILLSEPICAGPNHHRVMAELKTRGVVRSHEAASAEQADWGQHMRTSSRQQGKKLDADPNAILRAAWQAYSSCADTASDIQHHMNAAGFHLALGRKCVMLVHEKSGFTHAFARGLRIGAKLDGDPCKIRERDLAHLAGKLRPLTDVEEECRRIAQLTGETAVERTFHSFQEEAALDNDDAALDWLRKRRQEIENTKAVEFKNTLQARRAQIRARFAEADSLARRRVNRAFLAAKIVKTLDLERIAFLAVGAGVVLGGGGLGLALLAAGISVAALPSFERARALQLDDQLARRRRKTARDEEIAKAYGRLRAELKLNSQPLPDMRIPHKLRAIAGRFMRLEIDRLTNILKPDAVVEFAAVRDQLDPVLVRNLEALVETGDGWNALELRQVARRPVHKRAVAAPPSLDTQKIKAPEERGRRGGMRIVSIQTTEQIRHANTLTKETEQPPVSEDTDRIAVKPKRRNRPRIQKSAIPPRKPDGPEF
ncbi:MAG: hypothetical protein LCH61_12400, partial [Proteobacteria bacterium]|nr:hypothetical protein [Pseudomonadota bacterium]